MCDREVRVRSGNSRRKVRNKGGATTRRPSFALLGPLLMSFRARVFHHHSPCRAACCGTYLQGGNGVDVQGDSTGVYPAHCRDQCTRVTRGKWHGYTPPGLPSCRTWSASSQDGARSGLLFLKLQRTVDPERLFMLRFRGGDDRERSSTRR